MPLKPGDTFYLDNTGGIKNPSGSHLVICVVSHTPKGDLIVVPVVSQNQYTDATCVLNPADHSNLKHASCVSYGDTKLLSVKAVDLDVQQGRIVLQSPITDDALLLRIQAGLLQSDESAGWVLKLSKECGLEGYLKQVGVI